MRIAMALLAVSLALGTGCKKKESSDVTASQGSGSAAGSGSGVVAAGGGDGSGSAMAGSDAAGSGAGSADATQMAKAAGNCPSTVAKSTTVAAVKGKAIVLTVTSDDKDAIGAIQRRAAELVAVKKGGGGGTGATHDARGTHRGKLGLCPAHVPEGATIAANNVAKGVELTITPTDKLDELKAEIDARVIKAADWVKANVKDGEQGTAGGVGGGAGEHGSNHSGDGDGQGQTKKGTGTGGGAGTGGGGGAGTGGGGGSGAGACGKGGTPRAQVATGRDCGIQIDACCYPAKEDACVAAGCKPGECKILETVPGQVACEK